MISESLVLPVKQKASILALIICSGLLTTSVCRGEGGEELRVFEHGDWTYVLNLFVDDQGRVDYSALRNDRSHLDAYLETIHSTGPRTDPALFPSPEHELAYYINAYNALVFEKVLAMPDDASGVWGLGTGYRFFASEKVPIEGRQMSLKKLEDDVVRDGFRDPRVHAALSCASAGCPRLRRQAFEAATLDSSLDEAMAEMVSDPRHCRVDESQHTIWLSKIFDWFRSDFANWGGIESQGDTAILAYVNRYRREKLPTDGAWKIRFSEYDKSLNRQ